MKRTLINYLGILGIISLVSYTLAVVKTNNKEQRIMKDIDHKLSREIVNTAKAHDISLSNQIRATTKHPLNDKNKSKKQS
ncbi:MAG: hypothetical protein KH215_06960 [Coprobacillus sp.]|nr:hypothetical protein [Coprobacillus sp.]